MGKTAATVCFAIGIVMVIAGMVKAVIIGFYPNEVWWMLALLFVGAALAGIGGRVRQNLSR